MSEELTLKTIELINYLVFSLRELVSPSIHVRYGVQAMRR